MASQRNCATCSRPFTPPSFAPGKRFCSVKCRNDWHGEQRRLALAVQARLGEAFEEPLYERLSKITGVPAEDCKRVILALAYSGGEGA